VVRDALVLRSLRDRRRGLIGWSAGLGVLVAIQMAVYPTVRDSEAGWEDAVASFPEVLREILRITDYTSENGYLATELMSFVVPFVFLGLGASWGSRLTTDDEESGAADLILGLPISRAAYFASRLVAATAAVCLTGLAFVVALAIGGRMLSMSVPIVRFIDAGVTVACVGMFSMSIAGLAGASSGRRGIAMATSMSVGVGLFVLYSLAPLVEILDRLEVVNPWAWTVGSDPLTTGLDGAGIGATLVVSTGLLASAGWVFGRREIRG
jgi:ABC-2 type transport system permease protein